MNYENDRYRALFRVLSQPLYQVLSACTCGVGSLSDAKTLWTRSAVSNGGLGVLGILRSTKPSNVALRLS